MFIEWANFRNVYIFIDITINTEIVASKKLNSHGQKNTYIGRISIQTRRHFIIMTPYAILFDTLTYSWDGDTGRRFAGNDFTVNKINHRVAIRYM